MSKKKICFSGKKWINFIVAFGLKDEKRNCFEKSEKNLWKKSKFYEKEDTFMSVCPIARMKNYFPHIGFVLISPVRDKEKKKNHARNESHSLHCNWIRCIFNKSEMRAHIKWNISFMHHIFNKIYKTPSSLFCRFDGGCSRETPCVQRTLINAINFKIQFYSETS